MPLYYVRYDDENGENQDLFVVAATPKKAVAAWDKYYEGANHHGTPKVYDLTRGAAKLRQPRQQGAIHWTDIPMVKVKP